MNIVTIVISIVMMMIVIVMMTTNISIFGLANSHSECLRRLPCAPELEGGVRV